jgi:photosystem II stability/assembly factor-like uncharacterized protein
MKSTLTFALALTVFAGGWEQQTVNTRASFRGLSVVNEKVVWISGSRGTIVKTIDGGATWTVSTIPGKDSLDFRDIHAFDANTAVAMAAGEAENGKAEIVRTTDGGATWTTVYKTTTKGVFFDAISFWDAKNGIVQSDPVDRKLYLMTTSDGGVTWTRVDPSGIPEMLEGEAAFAASGTALTVQGTSNAWIATGGAAVSRVFRSTDRGRTWTASATPLHSGGAAGAFSVAFTDAKHGIVVGGDYSKPKESFVNVVLTDDGGVTWKEPAGARPPVFLSAVAYLPGTSGKSLVALATAGTATSSDGGQSWVMTDTLSHNAVGFASKDAGFAAGDRGRISKWSASVGRQP